MAGIRRRSCLYPEEWPAAEYAALQRVTATQGLFDTSSAARWSPATLDRHIRSYGTFLHYAQRCGLLNDEIGPAARASGPLLRGFVKALEERAAPCTIAIVLQGMVAILRAIDPEGDRSQLETAARYCERKAKPLRDRRRILVSSSELYEAGMKRMLRFDERATTNRRAAIASGDAIMMMMLAAKPVRLKNIVSTQIGVHLLRTTSGSYEWCHSAAETKNHRRIQAELPGTLTPFLDRWIQEIRPVLVQGNEHNAMWVTTRGDPMSRNTIYGRFCKATEVELGVRINPHTVRHIAATSIAVAMPESVRMIPFVLENEDRAAQKHYNLADQLSASSQYLHGLERRRQQALRSRK